MIMKNRMLRKPAREPGRRQEISRETRRLFLLFLAGVLLLTLCACSGGNKAGESGAGNTAVDENTLDYAFSMMTNFAAEACVEKLKSLGDDPEAADWLSFVTAVQEDRFDDAKALFLRLTETWGPEMKTLTEGRLHGLARFINRL